MVSTSGSEDMSHLAVTHELRFPGDLGSIPSGAFTFCKSKQPCFDETIL